MKNLSKLLNKEERIDYVGLAEHHPVVIKLYAENMRLRKKLEATYIVASGEAINWKEVGSKIADGVKKIWEMIKKVARAIWDAAKKFGKAIANLAKKIWEQIKKVWRKFTGKGDKKKDLTPTEKEEILALVHKKEQSSEPDTKSIPGLKESVELLRERDIIYITESLSNILSHIETAVSLVSKDKGKNVSNTLTRSLGDMNLNKFYESLKEDEYHFNLYLKKIENIANTYDIMKNITFVNGFVVKNVKNGTEIEYSIVVQSDDVSSLYMKELIIENALKVFKNLSEVLDDFSKVVNEKVDDMLKKIEKTFIDHEDKKFEDDWKKNNQTPDEEDRYWLKRQKKHISEIANDPQFKTHLENYLNRLQNIYKTNGHLLHEMFSFEQLIIKHTRNISTALGKLYDK